MIVHPAEKPPPPNTARVVESDRWKESHAKVTVDVPEAGLHTQTLTLTSIVGRSVGQMIDLLTDGVEVTNNIWAFKPYEEGLGIGCPRPEIVEAGVHYTIQRV